jgi:hypothetical protein
MVDPDGVDVVTARSRMSIPLPVFSLMASNGLDAARSRNALQKRTVSN